MTRITIDIVDNGCIVSTSSPAGNRIFYKMEEAFEWIRKLVEEYGL